MYAISTFTNKLFTTNGHPMEFYNKGINISNEFKCP